MKTYNSSGRQILSKLTTRRRQYFYISDPKRPGQMIAATYDPAGGEPIVVGVFPKMKTRQQFQWLAMRLDRLIDIFSDFQALNDYSILLGEELTRLDTTGLDISPGVRRGWEAESDSKSQEEAIEYEIPELNLPMRSSKIRMTSAKASTRKTPAAPQPNVPKKARRFLR